MGTAAGFEAYYAAISTATYDDEMFRRIVCDPWTGRESHEEAQAMRGRTDMPQAVKKPASFKVLAIFQDGSRRVEVLRDDEGLQELVQGASGVHSGQIWAWGPKVQAEVIRRLEAQGIRGIRS